MLPGTSVRKQSDADVGHRVIVLAQPVGQFAVIGPCIVPVSHLKSYRRLVPTSPAHSCAPSLIRRSARTNSAASSAAPGIPATAPRPSAAASFLAVENSAAPGAAACIWAI